MVVWGFGVWVLDSGFLGWGFQLMGFGAFWVLWGCGSLYKHTRITLGKEWCGKHNSGNMVFLFILQGWSVNFSIHSGVSHLKTYQQQVAAWLHAIMPNLMLFLESRSYFYLMQDAEIA